jgi:hypothetical protein
MRMPSRITVVRIPRQHAAPTVGFSTTIPVIVRDSCCSIFTAPPIAVSSSVRLLIT